MLSSSKQSQMFCGWLKTVLKRSFEHFVANGLMEMIFQLPFAVIGSFAVTNHLRLDPLTLPLKRIPSKAV